MLKEKKKRIKERKLPPVCLVFHKGEKKFKKKNKRE